MLDQTHQDLIRALIAAQVAVLEHSGEDINEHEVIKDLEKCVKEIVKLTRQLKKEFD